jgi:uncharacterized protein with von Willebrand factor type A (vWA) domain
VSAPYPHYVTVDMELAPLVAAFGRRLREAGLPVTPDRSARFAAALTLTRPIARTRLYWTARAVLLTDQAHAKAFDSVFFAVFGGWRPAGRPELPDDWQTDRTPDDEREADEGRRQGAAGGVSSTSGSRGRGEREDDERELPVPVVASDEERLRSKRFDALEPGELAQLYRLMSRLELAAPLRRTRRAKRARRGEHVDLRRTLRSSLRSGGDPVRLAYRKRREVRRQIVLLCDISGSMEPYARAYLQFLSCAGGDAEAFVFATRLTRITRALATRSPERAIQRAAAAAPDWSSGTRIGEALRAFNDRHGRRGMARGAVIVILSDGWERGEPELVAREMERLRRLAYRIVWVNPRAAAAGFAPRVGGMAAALPHVDALVSGHSLDAMHEVIDAIARPAGSGRWECSPRGRDSRWSVGSMPPEPDEEPWGSATPVRGSSVAMPSGYSPSRGRTVPGW